MLNASNLEAPVTLSNPRSAPAQAYINAAKKLAGADVDIAVPSERKRLFAKFFGRRAAA